MNSRSLAGQFRLLALSLWATVALALLQLPAHELPRIWLLALLTPAAVLAMLQLRPGQHWWRLGCVILIQVGMCYAALQHSGPLGRPAALAGTILWPMAFVAVRRRDADVPLALFLSFCVLLVGIILSGPQPLLVGGYLVAGTMVLRAEARIAALRQAATPRPVRPAATQLLPSLSLAMSCGVAMLALLRAQELLPTPDNFAPRPPAAASSAHRSIGLSDRFDLAGGGTLSSLRGERLVEVSAVGGAVPDDLYLRSGFFDVPSLDNWHISSFQAEHRDTSQRGWSIRRPLPRLPVQQLAIERLASGRDLVFVPAGICALQGLEDLDGSVQHEWFRQSSGSATQPYQVTYQDLRQALHGRAPDEHWRQRGLTRVAGDFDRSLLLPLLQQTVAQNLDTSAVPAAIAGMLWQRCHYSLLEPTGPYGHALLDFLFSCHAGYCMHFASAAAIMLRLADIPCRIGVGLYGGDSDGDPTHRVYGSQHAHAWVEIPYEGLGWVVFDPTPPAQRGHRLPQEDRARPRPPVADGDDQPTAPSIGARVAEVLAQPLPWLLALLLAMLSTLAPSRRRRPAATALPDRARTARRWLLRIQKELAARGAPRGPQQTLEEYATQLQRRCGALPALQLAFAAYQQVRFGGRALDAEREAALRRGLESALQLPRTGPALSGS